MAHCRNCGDQMQWAYDQDRGAWVPLVPVGKDTHLDRRFVDENGTLRADHRDYCINGDGATVNVRRLSKKVRAEDVLETSVTD